MNFELGQDAVDIGIIVTDSEKALGFYRDILGMDHEGDIPMPIGGGGVMHRMRCGAALIKLVCFETTPEERPYPGQLHEATGYRYFTIHAKNVGEVMDMCAAADVPIVIPAMEIRGGVTIGMVNDPDGNVVEFVSYS